VGSVGHKLKVTARRRTLVLGRRASVSGERIIAYHMSAAVFSATIPRALAVKCVNPLIDKSTCPYVEAYLFSGNSFDHQQASTLKRMSALTQTCKPHIVLVDANH
jgi:hypothetical protein